MVGLSAGAPSKCALSGAFSRFMAWRLLAVMLALFSLLLFREGLRQLAAI